MDESGGADRGDRRGIIFRERILRRLEGAAQFPIVVLFANAGYGKSEALRQYKLRQGGAFIHLNLSEDASTLDGFIGALADACTELVPGLSNSAGDAISGSMTLSDPVRAISRWASAHLSGFAGTVIIDDYQKADNSRTSHLLNELISATPNAKWIIASRQKGSLPLSEWVSYSRADQPITNEDMQLTVDEARRLAVDVKSPLNDAAIEDLVNRYAGWPLPIAYELRVSAQSGDRLGLSSRVVTSDLLASHLWSTLSTVERALLELAAVVPVLRLEQAVREGFDNAAKLAYELSDKVALITCADDALRIHDLLRQFIIERTEHQGRAVYNELLCRGARVHLGAGDLAAAIERILQTNDGQIIEEFIGGREIELANLENRVLLRRMLSLLDGREAIGIRVVRFLSQTDDADYANSIPLGQSLLNDENLPESLRVHVADAQRRALFNTNQFSKIMTLRWAEHRSDLSIEAVRRVGFCMAAAGLGQREEALAEAAEIDSILPFLPPKQKYSTLVGLAAAMLYIGDLAAAVQLSKQAFSVAEEMQSPQRSALASSNVVSALINSHSDASDLGHWLQQTVELAELGAAWAVLRNIRLAAAYFSAFSGRSVEALRELQNATEVPGNLSAVALPFYRTTIEAMIFATDGEYSSAVSATEKALSEHRVGKGVLADSSRACILAVRMVVLALAKDEKRAMAAITEEQELLKRRTLFDSERLYYTHFVVVALFCLQRYQRAGRIAQGIRGQGPEYLLLDRCYAVLAQDPTSPSLRAELEGHFEDAHVGFLIQMLHRGSHDEIERPAGFTITEAQTEVLKLLALGLSNKQIANATKRSEKTVKNHISAIFTRLGVNTRHAAVRVAELHALIK